MVQIPAGEFERGTNLKKSSDETPRRTIYLDAFEIDKYEATVADYEACIQAGACETPSNKYQDKKYFNYGAPGREKHPINGINWFQAEAFCKWAGKRLPTEAEWEKAARGTDGRTYPWGEAEPTCDYLVIKKNKFGCDRESTWPVGSKPYGKSPYGVYDMMGNAWEWTADWYQKDYFQSAPSRNPKGPSSGINRVSRGLGWFNDVKDVRVTNRFSAVPTKGPDGQGVRCAR
jgi:formylglycine-generating enzyme required for sulfatase activity